jgi:PAS domain S-box-containing protein
MAENQSPPNTEAMLRRYDFIVNTSKDWHTLINRQYVYEAANTAYCESHGMDRDHIIGASLEQVWGRETFEHIIKEKLDKCFSGHEVSYQAWFELPELGLQCYEVTYYPYRDEENTVSHVVVVTRNITRRKRAAEARRKLEKELQQVRKIEALSTLSGGIAHEFNNALMVVAGNIELLQMTQPDNQSIRKFAVSTNESIYRMSTLTQQLLAYAREGDVQLQEIHLTRLVKATLPELRRNIDAGVHIETELMDDLPAIQADAKQLPMILSAIVSNAAEAAEANGSIRIKTSSEHIDESFAAAHPGLIPGHYVCLTVVDDGKGMDAKTCERIFEPFFTTKFQGRGLGMAAVYGIIKNHRGYVYVESQPQKGTVVRILLPPADAAVEMAKACGVGESPRKCTVMVIDDDEHVLSTIRSLIEKLGHHVLGATTAQAAIALARTHQGCIDLALLDIKLPDMEGGTLFPLIKQARPEMKVIVCSGYSLDTNVQDILSAGANGFLQKPFAFKTFKKKLKEVLQQ